MIDDTRPTIAFGTDYLTVDEALEIAICLTACSIKADTPDAQIALTYLANRVLDQLDLIANR